MNTTTDTPTPSPHKHENTNSKLEELAKLEYDAVSGPIKAQDKLYSELESLRHDRLALMIANGANLKEATALKARVEKIEAELAEKNAEIEAFKANNRYMRGHTAGYEEAERKWKTRAEKAEKELAGGMRLESPRTRAIQAECAKLGPDYAVWYGYVCGELEAMERELTVANEACRKAHEDALLLRDGLLKQLAAKDREIARLNQCICVDSPKMLALNAEILTRAEKAEKELAEAINSDCESMAMFRRVRDERDALREEIEHIKAWANAKSDEVIALERNLYTGDDDEKKWLRAEVKRLKDQIGYIEASEHPDEQNPRAQTWLQERKNWIAEVERLRETLRTIKS